MEDIRRSIAAMRSVYELFADEARKHVGVFDEISSRIAQSPSLDEARDIFAAEAQRLEHRFHLLKGSAGFLKLEALQLLAARGNEVFRKGTVNFTDIEEGKQEFLDLASGISREVANLEALLREG